MIDQEKLDTLTKQAVQDVESALTQQLLNVDELSKLHDGITALLATTGLDPRSDDVQSAVAPEFSAFVHAARGQITSFALETVRKALYAAEQEVVRFHRQLAEDKKSASQMSSFQIDDLKRVTERFSTVPQKAQRDIHHINLMSCFRGAMMSEETAIALTSLYEVPRTD